MSLDTTILKLLKHRDKYGLYRRAVPDGALGPHAKAVLVDLGRFFDEGEAAVANPAEFLPWFLLAHPKIKDEAKTLYTKIIEGMGEDVSPGAEQSLLARLEEARQAAALTTVLEQYAAGEEVSVMGTVRRLAESAPLSKAALPEADFDIGKMLDETQNDWGFHWPQASLNASMRPLRPGDFGILAARVDQGKSSFTAHALAHFAPQVDELFPGEGRGIIVLNNEGLGSRLNQRLVNATLGKSLEELVELRKKGRDLWQDTLQAWGGRRVVTVYDVHDRPLSFLENIVRRTNPAIVVVDMLDNVPFDGSVSNGGMRTDQILEAAYQRARIWAVKYNAVVIASSQLSAEAAGVLYPGMHMLANSRTGKAGAADFVLCLGHSEQTELSKSRWLSLPKNKLHRSGGPKDPRAEVRFDGPRGLFTDLAVLQEE